MNGKRLARENEKTTRSHNDRAIHNFIVNNETYDFVMTKHGHYRILENKNITPESFAKHLLKIGEDEIANHFKKALEEFPLNERSEVQWEKQVDYTISVYDVVNELVVILGLHPHLKRITIITIVPRINGVYTNVFGAYRIDSEQSEHKKINEKLPKNVQMKRKKTG